jgi:glycosyltransferase involved in cell wall biosynthesis
MSENRPRYAADSSASQPELGRPASGLPDSELRTPNSELHASRSTLHPSRLPLSVYMITFNNGATLERALSSVSGWAGEMVVVDSHSTDGSAAVIERYADRFKHLDTSDFREKYQYAQDLCTNPWVLFLDADEWLTDEVKGEVEQVIGSNTDTAGYIVGRRNVYLGREIKHGGWYPDEEIRLYGKASGRWQGGLHAKVHVEGPVGRLKSRYMHTPYADTSHQIATVDRYAAAYAGDLFAANRSFRLFNMLGRPLYRLLRDYILKRGFLDGVPGLIIVASTMYYVFMKQAKLWEMERRNR